MAEKERRYRRSCWTPAFLTPFVFLFVTAEAEKPRRCSKNQRSWSQTKRICKTDSIRKSSFRILPHCLVPKPVARWYRAMASRPV